MSAGVFTRDTRISLVKGWLTGGVDPADGSVESGDGTDYPLEVVSLDQVAEIWTRVKDAWFTGGDYLIGDSGTFPPVWRGVQAPTQGYTNRAYFITSGTMFRGYTTSSSGLPAHNLDYLGDEYPANPLIPATDMYRDIADNERGMWMRNLSLPIWNDDNIASGYRNAFTFDQNYTSGDGSYFYFKQYNESAGISGPDYYAELTPTAGQCGISWGPTVAVVDDGVTIRYFMRMEFSAYPVSTKKDYYLFSTTGTVISPEYRLELGSGVTISCPLYCDVGPSEIEVSYSDFTQKAQSWWPYNRLAEPRQIWDVVTGEKIPVGAPFAAADIEENLIDLYLIFF